VAVDRIISFLTMSAVYFSYKRLWRSTMMILLTLNWFVLYESATSWRSKEPPARLWHSVTARAKASCGRRH
jgi:hypothetical protein